MFPGSRLHLAWFLSAGLGCVLAPAVIVSGCGPQAVGVESCRKIESARCDAALSCGFTKAEAEDCKLFYRDQCLHGIENTAHRPTEPETSACIAAIEATGQCAANGVTAMSACAGVGFLDTATAKAPCDVLLSSAHELSACAFAAAEADAGTTTSATTSSGGGGTGGSTGGTGGGTTTSGVGGTTK